MLICAFFFFYHREKTPDFFYGLVILITHNILSVPRLVSFVFSTNILFTVIQFVFLLLHKKLLHAQNMFSKNFPLKGVRFHGVMADSRLHRKYTGLDLGWIVIQSRVQASFASAFNGVLLTPILFLCLSLISLL